MLLSFLSWSFYCTLTFKNLIFATLSFNKLFDSNTDENANGISSVSYRELTKREADAYADALYRIKTEESVSKSKGR
jgi:hypothetical protein